MFEKLFYQQYSVIVLLAATALMLLIFLPVISYKLKVLINTHIKSSTKKSKIKDKFIEEFLDNLGYAYDARQDIFYSKLNAWQREMGYCRLYDEAAAPMSMIIDCEPIYFEYDNKRWLIEFWKGQYGMTTGCEIGIYATENPDVHTDFFNGVFYECVDNEDLLNISIELKKKGKKLFKRRGVHWWMTGFKLGEFSEPGELIAFITITLKDSTMRTEFVKGLKNAGYADEEIAIVNNTIRLTFDKPRTEQPYTRNELTEYVMQTNNLEFINKFNEATKNYDKSIDKIIYIKDAAPELFEELFQMLGRSKDIFNVYSYLKHI